MPVASGIVLIDLCLTPEFLVCYISCNALEGSGEGLVHLFPPNLGDSARILDKVHPVSAVRHISPLN